MKINVLGCGEAFDEKLGNTAFLLDKPKILFDCGYQIPERLWKIPNIDRSLVAVVLTHLHADHSFGLVPLLTRMWEQKRKKTVSIIGPIGTSAFLRQLFSMGYPGLYSRLGFPIEFMEVTQDSDFRFQGLRFRFAKTEHSVVNHSIRVDKGKRSFVISGDGRLTTRTISLIKGTDKLFQESFSFNKKIQGHMDLKSLEKLKSVAKRIIITHRSRTHRESIEKRVRSTLKSKFQIAKPGSVVEI